MRAYRGDAKTLLAFNLARSRSRRLAGFTIQVVPDGRPPYFLYNSLRFEHPERHTQDDTEPAVSSLNAPLHKFRWVHVPGSFHQGLTPVYGKYTYVVTPRYFDDKNSLQPLDANLSASVDIEVGPLDSDLLELGFTRGYTQSQAFVNHFGRDARIQPKGDELLFDTSQLSGTSAAGEQYTYAQEYEWLGFTARDKVFGLLGEVQQNQNLRLDMFAYDLNEPDLLKILLDLAGEGRVRLMLDSASLHHSTKKPKKEDRFQELFDRQAKAPAELRRGRFGRYAHDKVLIVSDKTGPKKVLTGSTNFSVTGLYVNSNHVLVFPSREVASHYSELFETVWEEKASLAKYVKTAFSSETYKVPKSGTRPATITFAPHSEEFATSLLNDVAARIQKEGQKGKTVGSVLFAVMETDNGTSPVYTALKEVHSNDKIFSFGITDSSAGISLYVPHRKTGVLVTGKPVRTQLPPPFNQVPGIGAGHQVHHKFVVCGFNSNDPVVYCGSSNLALGGEQLNGDNLLEIHDGEIVTAFAIEALALVDHFQFLDKAALGPKSKSKAPPASKAQAAEAKQWFLSTTDKWTEPYFDSSDLHYVDRRLFA